MPHKSSYGMKRMNVKKALSSNIAKELRAGKSHKQASAIAYSKVGKAKKMKSSGKRGY